MLHEEQNLLQHAQEKDKLGSGGKCLEVWALLGAQPCMSGITTRMPHQAFCFGLVFVHCHSFCSASHPLETCPQSHSCAPPEGRSSSTRSSTTPLPECLTRLMRRQPPTSSLARLAPIGRCNNIYIGNIMIIRQPPTSSLARLARIGKCHKCYYVIILCTNMHGHTYTHRGKR